MGVGVVDDFMDGVFFGDGIEHLFYEEGEAAGLVGVAGVSGGEVIIEILESLFMF